MCSKALIPFLHRLALIVKAIRPRNSPHDFLSVVEGDFSEKAGMGMSLAAPLSHGILGNIFIALIGYLTYNELYIYQ
jgi:hypothetical protein